MAPLEQGGLSAQQGLAQVPNSGSVLERGIEPIALLSMTQCSNHKATTAHCP